MDALPVALGLSGTGIRDASRRPVTELLMPETAYIS
jgi:hypothetical protein